MRTQFKLTGKRPLLSDCSHDNYVVEKKNEKKKNNNKERKNENELQRKASVKTKLFQYILKWCYKAYYNIYNDV